MGIKKKDDEKEIPEIHLHKKEPKFYFDEKLKRWVIEGEEIEPEKAKKPPPKGLANKNKDQKVKDKKNKKEIKSKYPSMFGEENIYKPEIKSNNDNENNNNIIQNDINNQQESEKINKKEEENNDNKNDMKDINEKEDDLKLNNNNNKEEQENDKLENSPEKINDENLNLNIHNNNDYNDNQFINGSNFKLLNSIKKLETQSELSEISLHKEDFSTLYQKELNDYKKNILEEEISKIKDQYNKNLKQKELEYEAQINELKEINQFTEETYNENTSVLKEQRNNFIKENLNLKSNLEKLSDELEFNKKQIQEYKNLVEHYKKLVEDNGFC